MPVAALFLALAIFVVLPASAGAAPPQDQPFSPIQTEASPQLFSIICALYAAGFPADSNLSSGDPAFSDLRIRLLALRGPATQVLREYYRQRALADPGATMSRYITFGLLAGPPPKFDLTLARQDLPPDVLALDGFGDVLAAFYQEAGIDQLWNQLRSAHQRGISDLLEPLGRIVLLETGYLREVLRASGRTFTVYVEPLVGRRSNVRNIGDHYAIVVGQATDALDQIRHAFLHFLLDPLPIRYADKVRANSPLLQYAARAPRLPNELRDDFPAFFTECLVRAVELRLRRLSAGQQAQELDSAEGQGYVLLRPMMGALAKFEASEPAMTLYFPDLVSSIDVAAELKRVQTVSFLPAAPLPESGSSQESSGAQGQSKLSRELEAALAEGERLIATQDASGAAAAFQRILESLPGQPRALYGLAVASVLQGDATRARELFERIVAAANANAQSDPIALAWSHVYLGRMHDLEGDRQKALEEYHAVLAIDGAPVSARAAAQTGIQQGYRPVAHDPPPG